MVYARKDLRDPPVHRIIRRAPIYGEQGISAENCLGEDAAKWHRYAFLLELALDPVDRIAEEGSSSFDESCVLVLPSHVQAYAFPCEVLVRVLGPHNARFAIKDKLLHGAVGGDPQFIDGLGQRFLLLVDNDLGSMPTGTSVDHVENNVFVNENEVAFDLGVEGVCYLNVACVRGAWLGPFSADLASLADFRYHLQHVVGDSTSLKHPSHRVVGGVPPSHVQLAQRHPDGSDLVGAKQANNPADIEVCPIIWPLGVGARISVCPADSLLLIWASASSGGCLPGFGGIAFPGWLVVGLMP